MSRYYSSLRVKRNVNELIETDTCIDWYTVKVMSKSFQTGQFDLMRCWGRDKYYLTLSLLSEKKGKKENKQPSRESCLGLKGGEGLTPNLPKVVMCKSGIRPSQAEPSQWRKNWAKPSFLCVSHSASHLDAGIKLRQTFYLGYCGCNCVLLGFLKLQVQRSQRLWPLQTYTVDCLIWSCAHFA